MTKLVVLEGVAIVLLGVLVVGLLRSHAEILRRLHDLGVGLDEDSPAPLAGEPDSRPVPTGRPAADISGDTPHGERAAVGVVGASHNTLVAFLSSGCLTCADFWRAFANVDKLDLPAQTRPLIVTRGPDGESLSAIEKLAPPEVTVVMSTEAWLSYEVPGSPYFVLVDGPSGRVAGEGTGDSWNQVRTVLAQALGESRGRPGGGARPHAQADTGNPDRKERVDAELLAAGIGPGHASLYPEEPDEG